MNEVGDGRAAVERAVRRVVQLAMEAAVRDTGARKGSTTWALINEQQSYAVSLIMPLVDQALRDGGT